MLTLPHYIFVINTPNHNWEGKLLYMTGCKVVKIYSEILWGQHKSNICSGHWTLLNINTLFTKLVAGL